jgi:hypothetical protein
MTERVERTLAGDRYMNYLCACLLPLALDDPEAKGHQL